MEIVRFRSCLIFVLACLVRPAVAAAGMPSIELTDLGKLRFSQLSFFLAGFLVSAWAIQKLWNHVQRDFPQLPVLTFQKATALVFLWGLLFVLVLTMISGARELMTPGAWARKGATYELAPEVKENAGSAQAPAAPDIERREQIERLQTALLQFAATHDGRYPAGDQQTEIESSLWQVPGKMRMKYVYIPGLTLADGDELLACEPDVFEGTLLSIRANGRIKSVAADATRP